jgi:hypothetical protein
VSRREATIKAVAAALQPKSLDLTSLAPARVANRVESTQRIPTEDASYAMGFAIADMEAIDGEQFSGDPLAVALLRLKYAEHLTIANFERALDLLLHLHSGLRPPVQSETLHSVAAAALVEWLNDRCPVCRGPRSQVKVARCDQCAPTAPKGDLGRKPSGRREAVAFVVPKGKRKGQRVDRVLASASPAPGCAKCKGLGRIFVEPEASRGMVCRSCHNSGLVTFRMKRRWRAVSELVAVHQKAHGQKRGFPMEVFRDNWHARYCGFIEVLRRADRRIGGTIDLGMEAQKRNYLLDTGSRASDNSDIALGEEEKQDTDPAEPGDQIAPDEPAVAHGRTAP